MKQSEPAPQKDDRQFSKDTTENGEVQSQGQDLMNAHSLVKLQRVIGNQGVQRMIRQGGVTELQRLSLRNPFKKSKAAAPKEAATESSAATATEEQITLDEPVNEERVQQKADVLLGQAASWKSQPPLASSAMKSAWPAPINPPNDETLLGAALTENAGYKAFSDYAVAEFSIENIYGLHGLAFFLNDTTLENAHVFYKVFSERHAEYELNVPSKELVLLKQVLSGQADLKSFVEPYKNAITINLLDTFSRYKTTLAYEKWYKPWARRNKISNAFKQVADKVKGFGARLKPRLTSNI